MKAEQKYKYVKSLIFNHHGNIEIAKKNNHFVYTVDFRGVLQLPLYIVGVNYECIVWDEGMPDIEKKFNYNDPLFTSRMQIVNQSTNKVYGDNVDLTITGHDCVWARYSMSFNVGVLYDLTPFPVIVSDPVNLFIFDVFIDNSYTMLGAQLFWVPSFKLIIGTN